LTDTWKTYLRTLGLVAVIVAAGALLNSWFDQMPGLGIGLLELLLELIGTAVLVSKLIKGDINFLSRTQTIVLMAALLALFVADGTYIQFYFVQKNDHPTQIWPLIASTSYALAFVSFLGFFILSLGSGTVRFFAHPLSLLVVGIISLIMLKLGAPLFQILYGN
jgi:hypothetical protein